MLLLRGSGTLLNVLDRSTHVNLRQVLVLLQLREK